MSIVERVQYVTVANLNEIWHKTESGAITTSSSSSSRCVYFVFQKIYKF